MVASAGCAAGSTLVDEAVQQCIDRNVANLHFRAVGTRTTVRVALTFSPR